MIKSETDVIRINKQDELLCLQEHFSGYLNTTFPHEELALDIELPNIDVMPNDMETNQELEKALKKLKNRSLQE